MHELEKRGAGEVSPPASVVAPEIGRIALTTDEIEAVATGDWDESTAAKLLAGEWSKNMILLRYVLGDTAMRPNVMGPLAPLAEAKRLLKEAEQVDAAVVRELLLRPTVGQWLGDTVRRLRDASIGEQRPMWADLGYFHTIAAVAAHKVGIDATMRVPSYDEQVVLPTLGRATLPFCAGAGGWRVAEVSTSDGLLAVTNETGTVDMPDRPNEDAPGWNVARWLTFATDSKAWNVLLDDLDHFTSLRVPAVPERLSLAAVEQWREVLDRAWEELTAYHPDQARQIAGLYGINAVASTAPETRFRMRSITSGDSPRSVMLSQPQNPVETAVSLVRAHCGHNILNAFQYFFPLFQLNDSEQQEYVPLRDQPRDAVGLLHDGKVFAEAAKFWRQRLEVRSAAEGARTLAEAELSLSRRAAYIAVLALQHHDEPLTDHGITFLAHVQEGLLGPSLQVPVSPAVRQKTYLAELDHALKWRAHYVPFAEGALEAAVEAWYDGQPLPPVLFETPEDLDFDHDARGLDIAAVLVRFSMLDQDALNRPELLPPKTTPADIALAEAIMSVGDLEGDTDTLKQIIGLMLRSHGNTPYGMVDAIYEHMSRISGERPDRDAVASWVAQGVLTHVRHQDGRARPTYRDSE